MSIARLQQAYLVRLWPVHRNGELLWRASIEHIHTGERHVFADLPGLYRFLEEAITPLPISAPADATAAGDQNEA